MSKSSQFCKAYLARSLREFAPCERQWQQSGHGLADEDVVYVHDDFVVRSGIFPEDEVVFDQVTDDWKHFCHERLSFEIPPI